MRQEGYYNEEIDDYEDELTDEEYDEEIEKIIAELQ